MKLKKLSQDKHIKIVAATSMTLFSLLTVFSACIAWFGMNKEVGAIGNNIVVARPNGKLESVDFYMFDDVIIDNSVVSGYKFFPESIGNITFDYLNNSVISTGNTRISLESYTPLTKEHPILLMFNLIEEYDLQPNEFRIEAITSRTSFLGTKQENGTPLHDLTDPNSYLRFDPVINRPYYAMSSVTQFMYQEFSSTQYIDLTSGNTLDFAFSDLVPSENFVSIVSGTEQSTFNSNPQLYVSPEKTVAHIALIIDYFPNAIEYIYSTYLGNDTLEGTYEYELRFECDWTLEILG